MAKYDPLHDYLRRQSLGRLELTFREIERLLGAVLPKSAAQPQWWANVTNPRTSHVQCRAWRDAGYKAFLVSGADRVRFVRIPLRPSA